MEDNSLKTNFQKFETNDSGICESKGLLNEKNQEIDSSSSQSDSYSDLDSDNLEDEYENHHYLKKTYESLNTKNFFLFFIIFLSFLAAYACYIWVSDQKSKKYHKLFVYDNSTALTKEWDMLEESEITEFKPVAQVCIMMGHPNQRHVSLFVSGFLNQFNSHVDYVFKSHALGKYRKGWIKKFGNPEMHPLSNGCEKDSPVLYFRRNFFEDKFPKSWDPYTIVHDGDEKCEVKEEHKNLMDYRQFYTSKLDPVKHMPLGPRYEFYPISSEDRRKSPIERPYLFNFVGSTNSYERDIIMKMDADAKSGSNKLNMTEEEIDVVKNGFLRFTTHWSEKPGANGGLKPQHYHEILQNSTFTLCPTGHNPESFRLYEAIESGSIPVVKRHPRIQDNVKCIDSLKPIFDTNPPFIFVEDWRDFAKILKEEMSDEEKIIKRQIDLLMWRKKYWSALAKDLECSIFKKHKEKTGKTPQNFNIDKYCT